MRCSGAAERDWASAWRRRRKGRKGATRSATGEREREEREQRKSVKGDRMLVCAGARVSLSPPLPLPPPPPFLSSLCRVAMTEEEKRCVSFAECMQRQREDRQAEAIDHCCAVLMFFPASLSLWSRTFRSSAALRSDAHRPAVGVFESQPLQRRQRGGGAGGRRRKERRVEWGGTV